jgi:hypothetical protein
MYTVPKSMGNFIISNEIALYFWGTICPIKVIGLCIRCTKIFGMEIFNNAFNIFSKKYTEQQKIHQEKLLN